MPVIEVWCLPNNLTEDDLHILHRRIVAAVVSVSELGLEDETDMTVLFPPDMMKYGLGEEIIVKIWGLLLMPERTQEVRFLLAGKVGTAVHNLFPNAKVECFVQPLFNLTDGFWTSGPPT